ncbi:MAG: autotransporter domain-containing protein [Verrucomicrobia bacterium]|nr:autotransporter domain-containing protein [Verrucomicrobiota bacterium]
MKKSCSFPTFSELKPHLLKMAFSSTLLFTSGAWATNYNVTSNADSGASTLRAAITAYNAAPTSSDNITITLPINSIITLASSLPPLNGGSGNALTIDATAAPNLIIQGNNLYQPFFVNSGNVSVVGNSSNPVSIINGRSTGATGGAGVGGGGGGGGSAGGGAIFINENTHVSISNCTLSGNQALGGTGGAGGQVPPSMGGAGGGGAGSFGGGVGGAGGTLLSGGGGGGGGYPGGGAGGAGGDPTGTAGGNNTLFAGGGGGGGTGDVGPAAAGGTGYLFSFGGAGGTTSSRESPGTGLGGGGGGGGHDGSIGMKVFPGGTFGGGGGGGGVDSTLTDGGDGGLGAGGGGGNSVNSGKGGTGGVGGGGGGGGGTTGVGGSSLFSGGTGGNGGIVGGNHAAGGGGGGSALGGTIFVHQTGTFTIGDNSVITGGSVIGGTGGAAPGGSTAGPGGTGGALGQQIFMLQGGTLNYNSSTNMTLANPIQGDGGAAGGTGGGVVVNGPGSLTLNGTNTYGGTTTINGGTFALAAGASVTAPITFNGGTLDLSANGGSVTLNNLSGSASSTIILGNTDLVANEAQDTTFAGTISGTGSSILTIQGTNTLSLLGTGNTYGGGTTIAGTSTCAIADNGSLGADGSTVTFGSTSSDDTTLQIGATSLTETLGSTVTFNKNMALDGKGHINMQSNNVTHTRGTSGANRLEVRARDARILPQMAVRGTWAHTGGTVLTRNPALTGDDGVGPNLILQGSMATLPTNGDLTMDVNTNFDMSDPTIPGAAQNLGNLNGAGAIQLGSNTLNLTLTADAEYDGDISDSASITGITGGRVVIDSSSSSAKGMILAGTNTHTGGTALRTVALKFCRDVNLGGPNVALQMGVAAADLPELDALCNQVTMSRAANLVADKNVIGLAGNELIHDGSLATTGVGKLHITGINPVLDAVGGIYHVKAPMQHTGGTSVEGGTLLMDGPNATVPIGKDISLSAGVAWDISPALTAKQSVAALTGLGRAQIDGNEIEVNPAADAIFDGPIRGSRGRIRKSGTNKWSLSNTHTYDGGTFIDDGKLAIINNGLLPPTGDMNIGSNSVEGNVEVANPILDISAANLDQTVGSLSGNGSLALGNTRRMTVAALKDSLYEGEISGGPNSYLTKEGLRDLRLSGISTATGTVEVNHGRLIIDPTGDTHTARTKVNPAGTLKGTGRVGHVQNTGFVVPGKSIGTLTTGDYEETGTLQIEVNPTQNSVLAVSGNMTINPGSTLQIAPDPGAYASTQTYTVVTVTGTGTGTYSSVTSTNPFRFKPTAIYNGFALADVGLVDPFIQIVLDVVPFANIIKGGNAGAVAKCFDTLSVNSCSDIGTVIQVLDNMSCTCSLGELREAFNEMQPSQFGALALAQENNDILVRAAITHRLDQVYPIPCEEQQATPAQQPGYYQNTTGSTQEAKQPAKKGHVWFAPMGKYANQGNQQHNPGYHQASGGALLGTDYEISDSGYLGTAIAYTFTDLDLKKSSGEADINSYYGTVYGNWFSKRVFIDAAFIAAYNHYHAKRHIEFIDRTARNGHNGYQLAGSLGTGMLFTPGHYQIQPFARADYVYLHQGSYKEHGARCLNLKIEEKNSQYIRTDLGVKVAYCYKSEKLKYVPYFKASWIWEKQIDEAHLKAHFLGSDCNFTVTGLAPHRSLFAPSIGITILAHEEALSVAIQYDAEVGHRFWENRAYLNLGFRY